jgi:tetratricopeptide (TPR) repeat protein
VDEAVARVVEQCLARDPATRPSAAQLSAVCKRSLSWRRQLRRWAVRHLGAVLVAAFIVLASGALAGSYSLHVRRHQYEYGQEAYRKGDYEQAVRYFSAVLEQEPAQRARALFARGRSYQQLNRLPLAQVDYKAADELETDGRVKACVAYCMNRQVQNEAAILLYEEAIAAGFRTAEVFNNLGYSYLNVTGARLTEAKASLDRAVALDPLLRAAYHNRALADLARMRKDPDYTPSAGLADIRLALQLGPETADLHYHAARLFGAAAERDNHYLEPALHYLAKAVEMGQDPRSLADDAYFTSLRQDRRFQDLLASPARPSLARRAVRLLDPVKDMP